MDLLEASNSIGHNILINKLNLYSIKTMLLIKFTGPIKTSDLDICIVLYIKDVLYIFAHNLCE